MMQLSAAIGYGSYWIILGKYCCAAYTKTICFTAYIGIKINAMLKIFSLHAFDNAIWKTVG